MCTFFFLILVAMPARAQSVPPELRDWTGWVLDKHPELACAVEAGGSACIWPGVMALDARDQGGALTLQVTVDMDTALSLPGGKGAWPQDVRVDGRPTPVLDAAGVPTVQIGAGRHLVSAYFTWTTRPASLPLPARIGLVELTVDGAPIDFPRIDADGLRLGAVQATEREDERLDIEVSRRVRDGVPVVVDTHLVLRGSGSGREVNLGDVLVPGTTPVFLSANLPARFTAEGDLVVQVRPGSYELDFTTLHEGPATELGRPGRVEPWPEVEYWVFAADERARAVNVGGATGIDPARTHLPQGWRSLPAFALEPATTMTFEELRRGDPEPPPNQISLSREIWVDMSGGGLTIRDTFTGRMNRGWRMNTLGPAQVGHVWADQADQVITRTEAGETGVELRSASAWMTAESRVLDRPTTLPAVGWDTDVQSLNATLNLPPGWTLLAGTGVDNLDGSVLDQWTLFDLFFVLVLSLAIGRLFGLPSGALALAALTLARHETGAPQWTWVLLLIVVGLARVMPEGWPTLVARVARATVVFVLLALLVPFAIKHVQVGLFPTLDRPWQTSYDDGYGGGYMDAMSEIAAGAPSAPMMSRSMEQAADSWEEKSGEAQKQKGPSRYLSSQYDPSAVVQTGPGVPTWTWRTQPLSWSGPVSAEHQMRLFLISPMVNAVLALLRVLLLGLLAYKLVEVGTWGSLVNKLGKVAPAALALLLVLPATGLATPDPALLAELEQRLTKAPPCGTDCLTVSQARLTVFQDELTYVAQVHVGRDAGWPVPGPTSVWVPERVTIDGAPTSALARSADGFLRVRLPPGVHTVQVSGALPPADAVALAFDRVPKFLDWSGEGWALDGLHADGTVDASVQLARMLGRTTSSQSAENLSPWLEVHRSLDLGIPWRVRTTVKRVGPADYPVSIKVPVLEGESVTESGFTVTDGVLPVTLDRDVTEVSWLSNLEVREAISLTAPVNVPWTEVWSLSCSPVFACTFDGPAPLEHIRDDTWSPMWRVWPGEQVTVQVSRPEGVKGQTTTIDQAVFDVRPGRRQLVGDLSLVLRSSQGGRQVLTLPEGAQIQSVTIDGSARPLQLRDGNELHVPLQPGTQRVNVQWQQERTPSFFDRVPLVDLGGPSVNVTVKVTPAPKRWIVALTGPQWGPVPLFWTYVLAVLVLAVMLGRIAWSPLATWQWALLGLGMTQVPFFLPLVVVAWLMAFAWRAQAPARHPLAFDLAQLGLIFMTLIAAIALYMSIHAGLLWTPDMQVAGNGSSDSLLQWFQDRADGPLPQPLVVSLPLWIWRVGMLLWALWLAGSLVAWMPRLWRMWTSDGWYRWPLHEPVEAPEQA